jgi:hypothetical protein
MDRGLTTLIGMSIAYLASFAGMGLAWWAWRRRHGTSKPTRNREEDR